MSPQNPGDKVYSVLCGRSPVGSFNYFLKVRGGGYREFQALPDTFLRFFNNPLYIRMISVITDKYPL
jgi:hypothetical protein